MGRTMKTPTVVKVKGTDDIAVPAICLLRDTQRSGTNILRQVKALYLFMIILISEDENDLQHIVVLRTSVLMTLIYCLAKFFGKILLFEMISQINSLMFIYL